MTLPTLARSSSMQKKRRVERFAERQLRQQKRRELRRSVLFLLASIVLIRYSFLPSLDLFRSQDDDDEEAKQQQQVDASSSKAVSSNRSQEERISTEEERQAAERGAQEEDAIIAEAEADEQRIYDEESKRISANKQDSSNDNSQLRPKKVAKAHQPNVPLPPLSADEAERLRQSHAQWERQARREQDDFCQQWQARLNDAAAAENLPPLVPSALEEIVSLFHNDQTFWMEVYPHRDDGDGDVDEQSKDIVSGFVLDAGAWEKEKTQRMGQWIQQYAADHHDGNVSQVTFVDIGANVGWYTLNMADLGANVIAIEPMAQNVQLLRRSLCRNPHLAPRVLIYPVGLSTVSNQTCALYADIHNIGDGNVQCSDNNNKTAPPPETPPFQKSEKDTIEYQFRSYTSLVRLDDLIGDGALPWHQHIAALKMDVEGYEGHVVAGGPRLLGSGRIPHVQAEYHPAWIRQKGGNPQALLDTMLHNAGYRVRRDALDAFGNSEPYMTEAQARNESHLTGLNDVLFEIPR